MHYYRIAGKPRWNSRTVHAACLDGNKPEPALAAALGYVAYRSAEIHGTQLLIEGMTGELRTYKFQEMTYDELITASFLDFMQAKQGWLQVYPEDNELFKSIFTAFRGQARFLGASVYYDSFGLRFVWGADICSVVEELSSLSPRIRPDSRMGFNIHFSFDLFFNIEAPASESD